MVGSAVRMVVAGSAVLDTVVGSAVPDMVIGLAVRMVVGSRISPFVKLCSARTLCCYNTNINLQLLIFGY